MEITEETRCWLCKRNVEELREFVEDWWASGSLEDMGLDACFEVIEVKGSSGRPIEVPLCIVCGGLMLAFLEKLIGGDPAEILTTADLEKFRIAYK